MKYIKNFENINNTELSEELIIACEEDDVKKVKLLLSKGVDINYIGQVLNTPLTTSVQFNSINVLKELLKHKELDINLKGTIEPDSLSGRDTPAIVVSAVIDIEIVKLLLKAGAYIDSIGHNGFTPLINASRYRMIDIVIYLIKNGANMHIRDNYGDNFEHYLTQDDITIIRNKCKYEYEKYLIEKDTNKYNL